MKRGYDLIASVYDTLATLVYGDTLRNAQRLYLPFIPPAAAVLIAGGGTGWILEEIVKIHQQGLYIDYIDVSAKMIDQAARRDTGFNEIHFINQSLINWTPQIDYDVIITPFFFDNFSDANARKAFTILHSALRTNGLWLYTDFQISHRNAYWQKAMLFVMYSFFRATADIEAKRLPDIMPQFRRHNYEQLRTKPFFHHFVTTSVFKKRTVDL